MLAAAALAGVELDFDGSFSFKSDWKTPEFLEKFPLGYMPVLEDGDLYLQEAGAQAEYGESSSAVHSVFSRSVLVVLSRDRGVGHKGRKVSVQCKDGRLGRLSGVPRFILLPPSFFLLLG